MTTAQQSSHLNANLPNLKAQTHDPLSEPAAALLAKEEREQLVPAAPLDKADAPAGSPSQAEASLPASASDTPQRATGEAPMGPEEAEKLLATIPEITIEGTEVLVKVPADLVGRMIGKNGVVIKELQLQSGAFINMSKDGEAFRLARISGHQAETRLCACLLAEKFTPAESAEKRTRLQELVTAFRAIANRPERQFVVESFSLSSDVLSHIAGRGGQVLHQLQDESRAKIDLPRSTGHDTPRRTVTISGSAAEVAACRKMLRDIVHSFPAYYPEDPYYPGHHYDAAHVVPSHVPYYPGYTQPYAMPQQYMSAPYGQAPYGDVYSGAPYMVSYPGGYYPSEPMAPDFSRLSLEHDDHVVPRDSRGATSALMPAPAMAMAAPPLIPAQVSESIISIPGDMVGRLIGRQGVAVKQLQAETHTRIDILDAAPHVPPTTRFVRISGPKPENVHQCIQIIQSRVAAFWGTAPMSPASSHQ